MCFTKTAAVLPSILCNPIHFQLECLVHSDLAAEAARAAQREVAEEEADNGVVTTINKQDATKALNGLFGSKSGPRSSSKAMVSDDEKEDESGVVTDISQNDAKNALAGLFGKRNGGHTLRKAKTVTAISLIESDNDDDHKDGLDIITPHRLEKYMTLSKIMPVHVLENRMKMDGVSKMLIGQLTKRKGQSH